MSFLVPVVNQEYEAQVYDVFVIKGNAAVFKCNIPSFVADHVEITSWEDSKGGRYLPETSYGKNNRWKLTPFSFLFLTLRWEPTT